MAVTSPSASRGPARPRAPTCPRGAGGTGRRRGCRWPPPGCSGSRRSRGPGPPSSRGRSRGPGARGVRRHRQGGVLVEQGGEGVHVVALEGVEELRGQRLRRPRRRRRLGSSVGRPPLGQRGPGPLQGAVDRGDGRVEQIGHLGGRPAQDLAEDEHGALPGRQVLEGGDEGQAHAAPGRRPARRGRRRRARRGRRARAAARTPPAAAAPGRPRRWVRRARDRSGRARR